MHTDIRFAAANTCRTKSKSHHAKAGCKQGDKCMQLELKNRIYMPNLKKIKLNR